MQSINDKFQEFVNIIKSSSAKIRVVYGVGIFPREVFSKLSAEGISIDAFAVTSAAENVPEYLGIPVIQADKMEFERESTLVIIGTKRSYHEEIKNYLLPLGYRNVVCQPDDGLFVSEMEGLRRSHPAIEITTRIGCRVDCKFCPQERLVSRYFSKDKNREALLSLDNYKKCLTNLPENTIITFSGFSEPFLNPQCADMICETHRLGYKMSLHTTLVGLTMEELVKIKDIPFEYVTLHLPDKDGLARIPVTPEYLKLLESFLDAGFYVDSNSQSTPPDEIIRLINQRITYTNITLLDRAGNIEVDEIAENISHRGKIMCPKSPALKRNILLPDGTLVLCCMDFGLEHEIGNLLHQNYDDIRKSKEFLNLRHQLMTEEGEVICRRCSLAEKLEG